MGTNEGFKHSKTVNHSLYMYKVLTRIVPFHNFSLPGTVLVNNYPLSMGPKVPVSKGSVQVLHQQLRGGVGV